MSEYGIDMKAFAQKRGLSLVYIVMHGRKSKKKLRKYARKYGIPWWKMMAGACEAVMESRSMYIKPKQREKAELWLLKHGLKPKIDLFRDEQYGKSRS